jgi:hypothetical protein
LTVTARAAAQIGSLLPKVEGTTAMANAMAAQIAQLGPEVMLDI